MFTLLYTFSNNNQIKTFIVIDHIHIHGEIEI